MNQITLTIAILTLFLASCQSSMPDSPDDSSAKNIDSISVQISTTDSATIKIVDNSAPDSTIYVNLITRLSDSSEYYLPLSYRREYTAETRSELVDSGKELNRKPLDLWRSILNDSLARMHLHTDNTESILVLNKNQNIIDTLNDEQFEHVSHEIEDFMATTYRSNLKEDDYLVMSNFGLDPNKIKPSPEVFEDSTLTAKIINKYRYKPEQLYSSKSLVHYEDTLTYVSFTDYQNQTSSLYLFKNTYAVDSIFDHFIVLKTLPVPLASKYELIYLAKCGVPDSDVLWNSLIGIDLKNSKFNFYPGNRLKIKTE